VGRSFFSSLTGTLFFSFSSLGNLCNPNTSALIRLCAFRDPTRHNWNMSISQEHVTFEIGTGRVMVDSSK
jgi:hypothetical protein